MHKATRILIVLAILGLSMTLSANAAGPKGTTVWDVVQASPSHETLEAAINCTGLSGALSGNGQRTLFAPTDAAFSGFGLTAGNICAAFTTEELTAILADHVAKGRRNSTAVASSRQIRMISRNKQRVVVELNPTMVFVGGAKLDLGFLDIGTKQSPFLIGNGLIHFVGEGIIGLGLPAQ